MSTGKHQVDRKKVTTLAKKRDRAAYFREYRKRKFLDNDMVEVTVYIHRGLRDKWNENLKRTGITRSEWLETRLRKIGDGLG